MNLNMLDKSSRELRLWMINHYAITPDMPGGRRHFELASLLDDHGWATTIFASSFSQIQSGFTRSVSALKPSATECIDNVRFRWLFSLPYSRNNWRRYANMASFAAMVIGYGAISRRPDLVIGSSPHLLAALGAWAVARRHRLPFVLEVRDLWPESLVQLGLSNSVVIKVLEFVEHFLYSKADLIVPLTEGIESGIRKKGFEHKSIVMVPNATLRPMPLNIEARNTKRHELGWDGKTVAIWIGAHGPANGLDVIVEAARLLQQRLDLLFVLVGGGSDKPRLIEKSQGLRNIQFLDAIPKNEVDEFLRAADIGLLVHRDTDAGKGARPNKLFDYMAARLPIVNNLDGEARRLVKEANSGVYIPAEQPDALAVAVMELYRSPDQQSQLGYSGYQHVVKAHSREDTAETLNNALREVLQHWEARHGDENA